MRLAGRIGTIYATFVGRTLESWPFGVYSSGQSILIGTPSRVTLASEGGAHQSIYRPSISIEQLGVVAWEPRNEATHIISRAT